MKHAIISAQGPKGFMEDTHYYTETKTGAIFAGVYDGHKGKDVSEYAAGYLHKFFFKALDKGKKSPSAFTEAYLKVSEENQDTFAGSTAVNAYIKENKIYWANAGDSHIIVINKHGKAKQLSANHRVDNPAERKRIEASGGAIIGPWSMKGSFGIQPTRALGDEYFTEIGILHTPSTGTYKLQKTDAWAVLYSDGLGDEMKNKELGEFLIKYKEPKAAARALEKEILQKRGGTDNLTAILIKLEN